MTDDQAIVQVEWRPLTADDLSLGAVTVEHADGIKAEHGHMTKADTARFAALLFGSHLPISAGGRIVRWTERGLL